MQEKKSLDSEYFKGVYDANDDPWNFETSEYEAAKYAATIEALPRKKYKNALEIGCSIGVLTKLLADRAAKVLATDISSKALKLAKERCSSDQQITFRQLNFQKELPDDHFDLIMISEVAYYLSPADWSKTLVRLYDILQDSGHIVLVHWLPEVHDYPQTGDEVHESFAAILKDRMHRVYSNREDRYRIDIWEKS